MKNLIESIQKALKERNFYAALYLALTLPDICGKITSPSAHSKDRYIKWFDHYLSKQYSGFLTGNDCYALRCAALHEGNENITEQDARSGDLEYFVFLEAGPHCNHCRVNSESFLQLNVEKFCQDIITGVERWLEATDSEKTKEKLTIYKPGEKVINMIRFGTKTAIQD